MSTRKQRAKRAEILAQIEKKPRKKKEKKAKNKKVEK